MPATYLSVQSLVKKLVMDMCVCVLWGTRVQLYMHVSVNVCGGQRTT